MNVFKINNDIFYALDTPAAGKASVICLTVRAALHYRSTLKYISLLAHLTAVNVCDGY